MNVSRATFCVAAILGLVACPNKDKNDGASSASPSSSAPPVVSAAPPADAKPAIEPRVKAEVDGRPEGITGAPVAVPGALASLQSPAGWANAKAGDFTTVTSADKKAHLAASTVGADGAAAKLPGAATAFGVTDCEWGPPEAVVVGKTKLAATAADGVCKRGTTVVRTAYVSPTAEKLLVVGAWEPDGDSANVFGALRSIAKIPVGDTSGIAACCAALRQNARSAPPDQQSTLIMAANVCDSMRTNPQGRAALAQIRAGLRGAKMPSACR